MATHSSILAWRIPRTEEPSGLPSMGSHRVRHDWSDLAAAAAAAGSWGPLSYGQLVRNAGTKLDLWLVPEVESGLMGLNSVPVESDAISQSCPTLCNPLDCNSPGSSVHRISQGRILDGVAISFSRGSSWARNQTLHCRQILYGLSHLCKNGVWIELGYSTSSWRPQHSLTMWEGMGSCPSTHWNLVQKHVTQDLYSHLLLHTYIP